MGAKFSNDIKRMFKNCKTFWDNFTGGDKYVNQAKKLEDIYNKTWKELQKSSTKIKRNNMDTDNLKMNHTIQSLPECKFDSNRKRMPKPHVVDCKQPEPLSSKKRMTNNSQQSLFQGMDLEVIELDDENEQDPLNISTSEGKYDLENCVTLSGQTNLDLEVHDVSLVSVNNDEDLKQSKWNPDSRLNKRRIKRRPGPASKTRKKQHMSAIIEPEYQYSANEWMYDAATANFKKLQENNNQSEMVTISFSKKAGGSAEENALFEYINNSDSSTDRVGKLTVPEEDIDEFVEFSTLPLDSVM